MHKTMVTLANCLILAIMAHAQKLGVIGSSTAAGGGANPIDSSWVNLTTAYYQNLNELTTTINLAQSGKTSFSGMPTGFVADTPLINPAEDSVDTKTMSRISWPKARTS